MTPMVHVRPTAYSVTCLPDEHPERSNFTMSVVCRDHVDGRWAVVDRRGFCLSDTGAWDYEHIPSERSDEWKAAHRFTRTRALELAVLAAPGLTVGPDDCPLIVDDMLHADPWAARATRLAQV